MKSLSIVPRDTSLEAFRLQLAVYRKMSPEARLLKCLEWSEAVRELNRAGIHLRHPEYSDQEVQMASVRLQLGDELFRRIHPGVDIQP